MPYGTIFVFDFSRIEAMPSEKDLAKIKERVTNAGAGRAFLNYNCDEPGAWEPQMEKAEIITAKSSAAAYSLLDRGIRCVELPPQDKGRPQDIKDNGNGKNLSVSDRIHSALLEAMIRRKLGERPAVSIVVPLYNTLDDHLVEMILSVLDQDDQDWELVLLDNGDPGVTGPVVRRHQDRRIRYFGGLGGRGIAMGRNLGNMLAQGLSIAVMDHDDMCAPGRVGAIKSELAGGLLYSDVIQLFPDGSREPKKLKLFSKEELKRDCNIYHSSVAYPWELAREIPYDPRFEPADDYSLYLNTLRRGKTLIHVNDPLLVYRRHPVQYSEVAGGRLQAKGRAARADDRYLEAGRDPLDKETRFEPLIVQLLAHGLDSEAKEFMVAGYGSGNASEIAGHLGLCEPPGHGFTTNGMRQMAWVILSREGEARAAEFLMKTPGESGLTGEDFNDTADLLFRTGDFEASELQLSNALGQMPRLCLPAFNRHLSACWRARAGDRKPRAPEIAIGEEESKAISLIIAAREGERASIDLTLASIAKQTQDGIEVLIVAPKSEELQPPRTGAKVTILRTAEPSPGAKWNHGLSKAKGKYAAFVFAGDTLDPDFLVQAVKRLDSHGDADGLLGQVRVPGGIELPGRVIGLSPLLRDERAMLCGCVFRKKSIERIGGFIPPLESACAWEFMIRAIKEMRLLQPGIRAGASERKPFAKGSLKSYGRGQAPAMYELQSMVKHIHCPLRYLDYMFSGAPEDWLAGRFAQLDTIASRSPILIPFLDPWEYLSEFNEPYHLLYRLARDLEEQGLFKPARFALLESIRLRSFEPKLWTRLALLFFRSLLVF